MWIMAKFLDKIDMSMKKYVRLNILKPILFTSISMISRCTVTAYIRDSLSDAQKKPNILNQSLVQIHLDTSSYPLTVSITNALFNEVLTFLKNFMGICEMPEYLVSLPYTLEDPVTKIDTADFHSLPKIRAI